MSKIGNHKRLAELVEWQSLVGQMKPLPLNRKERRKNGAVLVRSCGLGW